MILSTLFCRFAEKIRPESTASAVWFHSGNSILSLFFFDNDLGGSSRPVCRQTTRHSSMAMEQQEWPKKHDVPEVLSSTALLPPEECLDQNSWPKIHLQVQFSWAWEAVWFQKHSISCYKCVQWHAFLCHSRHWCPCHRYISRHWSPYLRYVSRHWCAHHLCFSRHTNNAFPATVVRASSFMIRSMLHESHWMSFGSLPRSNSFSFCFWFLTVY